MYLEVNYHCFFLEQLNNLLTNMSISPQIVYSAN